jgi:predicted nucleic acid-binding protein
MTEPLLQYWDSVVFIGYLAGEADRAATVQTLLRHVEAGSIRLVTSTLTIAEVRCFSTYSASTGRNNPDHEKRVEELFGGDQIEFRAVTDFIAREAQRIGCAHNELSPADCIHIATAIDVGASALLTWDGASASGKRGPDKMLTYNKQLGSPPLEIVVPSDPWPSLGLSDGDVGRKTPFRMPQQDEPSVG